MTHKEIIMRVRTHPQLAGCDSTYRQRMGRWRLTGECLDTRYHWNQSFLRSLSWPVRDEAGVQHEHQ